MNWSEYRTSHLQTYGSTTREQLSKDYQQYKKTLKSPKVRTSLFKSPKISTRYQNIKSPAVRKAVRSPMRSPTRQVSSKQAVQFKTPIEEPSGQSTSYPKSILKKIKLSDIEKLAKNKPFLMVVIYADYCGFCVEMKKKLGKKMKNTDKIMFYSDDQVDQSLKEYYPRVFYYEKGEQQKDLDVNAVYDYLL